MGNQFDINKPYAWLLRQFEDRPIFQIRHAPREYNDKPQRFVRVSFSELQRLYLRKLQCKLALSAVRITFDDPQNEPEGWEDDLKKYSKFTSQREILMFISIQTGSLNSRPNISPLLITLCKSTVEGLKDLDYMISRNKDHADPCFLTAEREHDEQIIIEALSETNIPENRLDDCGKMGSKDPLYISRSDTEFKRALRRLWMAVLGGAFLIGPMWLMVLHNTLYTGLVSTTVCVAMFGVVMALRLDDEKDVLSSTAAYAAVLVVFVGLNNNGS